MLIAVSTWRMWQHWCTAYMKRLQVITAGKEGTAPIPVTLPDGRKIRVWPVLACVEGDIPWMEKITNSVGHTAKRACFRCATNGVWIAAANAVRYAPRWHPNLSTGVIMFMH